MKQLLCLGRYFLLCVCILFVQITQLVKKCPLVSNVIMCKVLLCVTSSIMNEVSLVIKSVVSLHVQITNTQHKNVEEIFLSIINALNSNQSIQTLFGYTISVLGPKHNIDISCLSTTTVLINVTPRKLLHWISVAQGLPYVGSYPQAKFQQGWP